MVVGGGDSAMEEANFLTRFGSEVTLVHRREQFRASKIMLDRATPQPEDQVPHQHRGGRSLRRSQGLVTGVRLRNMETGAVWDEDVDGFFVAIGHIPNTAVFKGQIETDADGYILSKGGAQDQHPRRVPCRRRAGPRVPAGDHGRRRRLHGGHRSGAVPRSGRTLKALH